MKLLWIFISFFTEVECEAHFCSESAVEHFSTTHPGQIHQVQGSWSFGNNLTEFNEHTRAGLSLEEAAEHGFTEVNIEETQKNSNGTYSRVRLNFIRPTQ